jgi:hypothetical protein
MREGLKVIMRDMGITIGVAIIVAAIVVGIGSKVLTKEDDGPIEEIAEDVLENQLEKLLGLQENTLGIDLSPGSDEA